MLKEQIPFFEKNIIQDERMLENLLESDTSLASELVYAQIFNIGFKEAMDSPIIQAIWERYSRFIDENGINHRLFSQSYYVRSISKVYSRKEISPIFDIEQLLYLNYGVHCLDENTNTIDIFCREFLNEDKSRIVSNVPPVLLENTIPERFIKQALSQWKPRIKKGENISEFFDRNLGYLNKLEPQIIKEFLLDYMTKSDDFLTEMVYFFSDYNGCISDSVYDSLSFNRIKVDKILNVYIKLLLESELEYLHSLPMNVDFEGDTQNEIKEHKNRFIFNIIVDNIKSFDVIPNHILQFENLICLIKKEEELLEQDYSLLHSDFHYSILNKMVLNGFLPHIYLIDGYQLNGLNDENKKQLLKIKDKIVFSKKFDNSHWVLDIEQYLENINCNNEYKLDDRSKMSSHIRLNLYAIFGESIKGETYNLKEEEIAKMQKENAIIENAINDNKEAWFEFEEIVRKHKNKEDFVFMKLKKIKPEAIKELINIKKTFEEK